MNKHQAIFARGVEAYRQLEGTSDELYRCPLCLGLFDRSALIARLLTLEHVPPQSIGGKAICLTCKECNNAAGATVDAARSEFERMRAFNTAIIRQSGSYSGPVKVSMGGVDVNAMIQVEGQKMTLHVHEERNNPKRLVEHNKYLETLVAAASAEYSFGISTSFKLPGRHTFISDLRAAYLATFALLGYRYILQPQLADVRKQIQKPESKIIPSFAQQPALTSPVVDQMRVVEFTKPLRALAVQMRQNLIFLPPIGGSGDFYSELTAASSSGPLNGQALGWPTGMQLCLDFADSHRKP